MSPTTAKLIFRGAVLFTATAGLAARGACGRVMTGRAEPAEASLYAPPTAAATTSTRRARRRRGIAIGYAGNGPVPRPTARACNTYYSVCSRPAASIRGQAAMTRAIELRTAIPGPRSAEILERKERVVADPLSIYLPIVIAEGRGALAHRRGRQHLRRLHRRRRLPQRRPLASTRRRGRAGAARSASATPTSRSSPTRSTSTLAERLIERAPISGPAKAAFFNAGTEAVENAVKFARAYTGRPAVIAFEGGFHGRTLLSLSLTSKTHPYKAGLGPFAPEVYRVPFPQDYRGPTPKTALAALERAFVTQVAAENVAAIVIEPVQGEGGFVVAPPEFLAGSAGSATGTASFSSSTRCRPGSAAPGKFFAIEHYDVEPDLITVAKSIAAGPAALGGDRPRRDHGRARRLARSAAPTSATRSRRRPRSPSST